MEHDVQVGVCRVGNRLCSLVAFVGYVTVELLKGFIPLGQGVDYLGFLYLNPVCAKLLQGISLLFLILLLLFKTKSI
jgi:hypothetical protein